MIIIMSDLLCLASYFMMTQVVNGITLTEGLTLSGSFDSKISIFIVLLNDVIDVCAIKYWNW